MAKIKVILQADVAGLGEEGDVREVAGGYARNYLLPRKLVAPATRGNLKVLEQQRAQIEVRQEQYRAQARTLADRLAGMALDFPVRVGEQGRLYGSITAQDIADRLKAQGVEVDRRTIELREPLRALGTFDVPVRVAHAVTAHLTVTLRDQSAPVAPAASDTGMDTDTDMNVDVDMDTPPAEPEPPTTTEAGTETLGEDAVPLGAAPVDTVVPSSELAPEPFQADEQGAGTGMETTGAGTEAPTLS